MTTSNEKNDFWDNIEVSYPLYPTVRHRTRFILQMFKKYCLPDKNIFVFDYGCGTGDIISAIKNQYNFRDDQIGGSDMSAKSIAICRQKIASPYFYQELYPNLPRKCDVIICSEVIEHAVNYQDILQWIQKNLKSGGVFLLSTQGGKMHKIDEYSGHVQTFKIKNLKNILETYGFKVAYFRQWGWPLFTWQKILTDINFDKIKNSYLEGSPSKLKRYFFNLVYWLYFIEDIINYGPQLYICAINEKNDLNSK